MTLPDGGQRAVDSGSRAVDEPAARVLQNRYTQRGELATQTPATNSGQAPAPPPSLPSPFPDALPDPGFVPAGDPLATCLQAIANDAKFKDLYFAVVDLTGSDTPRYVGFKDTVETDIGSVSKLGIMFAAYALRDAVNRAAAFVTAKTAKDFLLQIESAWAPLIESRFPKKRDHPKLANIFTATFDDKLGWIADFTDSKTPKSALPALHKQPSLPKDLGFLDTMKLAIGWSDNTASGVCSEHLGFQYINGALQDAGLYDPAAGGLWLGVDFFLGTGWWEGPSKQYRGGNAISLARFMTLLAQDKLLSRAACIGMKQLLSLQGVINFFAVGLASAGRTPQVVYEKVGIEYTTSEASYFERQAAGITLRYVAIGLNDWKVTDPDAEKTKALIVRIDDCILAAHAP